MITIKDERLERTVRRSTRMKEEFKPAPVTKAKSTPIDILCWMPKRKAFEFECDQDAEQFIAQMEFHDNDSQAEKDLKQSVLSAYNLRLDERERRKNFVLEWNYLDLSKLTRDDPSSTKEEKDIFQILKPLARFHPKKNHYKLMEDIIKLRGLKQKVEELK